MRGSARRWGHCVMLWDREEGFEMMGGKRGYSQKKKGDEGRQGKQ